MGKRLPIAYDQENRRRRFLKNSKNKTNGEVFRKMKKQGIRKADFCDFFKNRKNLQKNLCS